MGIKITEENYKDLGLFVRDNLREFNINSRPFEYNAISKEWPEKYGTVVISASEIRKYLNDNYKNLVKDAVKLQCFEDSLRGMEATTKEAAKTEFFDIAIRHSLNIKDVENHYTKMIKEGIIENYISNIGLWQKDVFNRLLGYANSISSKGTRLPEKYIRSELKKSFLQGMYWILNLGFGQNLTNEVKGQEVANAGDSAQFLFVGRAILAGFNCSNVDLRSSSYDAIISRPSSAGSASFLKTVQIKGLIPGNDLPLKKRPRGGSGSDSTSGRNVSRFLSSQDADLLAAVDKQFGTCYIIPMTIVDDKVASGIDKISWSELEKKYKENWQII